MFDLVLSPLEIAKEIEIVERKGAGHPDSICDALAETLSRNLCIEYKHRCGEILHHNVDKALLCGGRANPAFGGGSVVSPIQIFLAGRAIGKVGSEVFPVKEMAIEGSRAWLKQNLHALDADHDVNIDTLIQEGSQHLQSLFSRSAPCGVPLSNDTSIGVGYAPLSSLERLVLAIDHRLHVRARGTERPAWGEDIKIMAVRCAEKLQITVACAMIGRFLAGTDDYLEQKARVAAAVRDLAIEHGFPTCDVIVNAADDVSSGNVYLTVTGTSAEAGDDGQVGRGNRVNGLITPCRPMSLEAAAGKNPVSHVGKIYNILAKEIAEILVSARPEIESAECLMVSKIGAPVSSPALVQIKLATRDGIPIANLKRPVEELLASRIVELPNLVDRLMSGTIKVF
jgi:S-adenosylmethionine synthetase